jgi:Cytochrome c554 and c-prime
MAHAAISAADSKFLDSQKSFSFRIDSYQYEIAHTTAGVRYDVNNGTDSVSALLDWAFGSGVAGQTYVYEQGGTFYESFLSYYTDSRALDFTTGNPRSAPSRLDTALGRPMSPGEARLCFGCHSTASTAKSRFDPEHAMLGVTCEACHGPGAQHVVTMNLAQGTPGPTSTFNPATLGPVDSVEFCGACHRTKWDVVLSRTRGLLNVRFQPYRLESSRCFGEGDARITCVACHDPHKPLVRDLASYDKQCLSCHLTKSSSRPLAGHLGKACPTSENNCVTCHMPKIHVEETHRDFTDHKIRIVRSQETFPD